MIKSPFTGNEFLRLENCEYEVLGFFEDLYDQEFGNFLGSRTCELDRPLGEPGRKSYTFTEDLILQKGHRDGVRVRASVKKPIQAYGVIQIICGKIKEK
jgi:hypothetical protein